MNDWPVCLHVAVNRRQMPQMFFSFYLDRSFHAHKHADELRQEHAGLFTNDCHLSTFTTFCKHLHPTLLKGWKMRAIVNEFSCVAVLTLKMDWKLVLTKIENRGFSANNLFDNCNQDNISIFDQIPWRYFYFGHFLTFSCCSVRTQFNKCSSKCYQFTWRCLKHCSMFLQWRIMLQPSCCHSNTDTSLISSVCK